MKLAVLIVLTVPRHIPLESRLRDDSKNQDRSGKGLGGARPPKGVYLEKKGAKPLKKDL